MTDDGPATAIYNRFSRSRGQGFWLTLLDALVGVVLSVSAGAAGAAPPPGLVGNAKPALPGYEILASARLVVPRLYRDFEIVAFGREDEGEQRRASGGASARPLLIIERRNGRLFTIARNDHIVMRADEGGQCDPFLDGNATIAAKDRFFTVENGVACGQHWTDYVTFRLDDKAGFVFDNERIESWSMNPSNVPDEDALVRDGPQRVIRAKPGHVTPFSVWRPTR